MGCGPSKPEETKPVNDNKSNAASSNKQDVQVEVSVESRKGGKLFLDEYAIGDVLGKGSFSVVRQATRKADKVEVAVKCIQPSTLSEEDLEALKIEIDVLKQMDHKHIIKLYDVFYEPSMYYIVTELMSGGELFDRIVAKEYYVEGDAQKVVKTLAEAIKYCHDRGVVHRDLKPENVLLSNDKDDATIKIADFGFAKHVEVTGEDENSLSTACGTPGYVAPEIISGKKYGKEVDLWSLGVITYILLCGYPPFHDDNQAKLFRLIRSGQFQFDSPYWDNISDSAKEFVQGLLTVDPQKRLSVDDLFNHAWLKEEGSEHDITSALDKLKSFQARKRWKAGVAAVGAVSRMQKMAAGGAGSAAQDSKDAGSAKVDEAEKAKADGADKAKDEAAGDAPVSTNDVVVG